MTPLSLVAPLLALQIAVFGWRINREIALGDQERRTWLPVPDLINVASLLVVVALCVVEPLMSFQIRTCGEDRTGDRLHADGIPPHYRRLPLSALLAVRSDRLYESRQGFSICIIGV